jgi:hypothetical protein
MKQSNNTSKQKQSPFNWRGTIVGILGCIAFIFLIAEPAEDAANWTLSLLGSQAIGYAFGAASVILFNRWEKRGYFPE